MPMNNPDEMVVTYASLDSAATALGTQAKKLETDLADIKRMVASVAETWEGDAHSEYTRQQAQWDKEANDIHTALTQIAHVVGMAGGHYQGGDRKAASYFM